MLLKVGELAKRTGLTVRTLHHYDAVGLLKASQRSDSGYRLYDRDDVARLHGIQTLRHMGLPLSQIARLLAGQHDAPGLIIDQQMHALDQEIVKATELRARLALMRDHLQKGGQPAMDDWLATLSLMSTYGKYFSAAELQLIFKRYKPLEAEWQTLTAEVRAVITRGVRFDSAAVQPLADRWMNLMHRWMGGDFDLMARWGHMYQQEPSAQGRNQAPEGDLIDFISKATTLRMALLNRYLQTDELRDMGHVPLPEWRTLEHHVTQLVLAAVPVSDPQAKAALAHWSALLDRVANHNPSLRVKLLHAYANEPLLQAGSPLGPAVSAYLGDCLQNSP